MQTGLCDKLKLLNKKRNEETYTSVNHVNMLNIDKQIKGFKETVMKIIVYEWRMKTNNNTSKL